MNVLLASSEVHPYSKSGGLADMVGALAKSLAKAGHQVGLVTPLYQGIFKQYPALEKLDGRLDLPLGPDRVEAEIWALRPLDGLTIYFVDQPQFFDRPGLYQENGVDYPDNPARFIFFSKAVVHVARYLASQPEVLHVHDWHAGLIPVLVLHQRYTEEWANAPRTCLTIHNLAYQGNFSRAHYDLTNLPFGYFNSEGVEFYGGMNCLKAGIAYADAITTVSPRYAREITTEAFGCGLDGILRRRQNALTGILNGVDYDEWKTVKNPYLKHSYDVQNLGGKTAEKLELQAELGLPVDPTIPLFGTVTRLVAQKGVDILLGALEEMLASNMQFVLLGSGLPVFEDAFQSLTARFGTKVAVRIGFDQGLSHQIEAACDFYLMPSAFEPCGLNQMYSLCYGAIPIVRRTGGLDDSVIDAGENAQEANGIKFTEYSTRAFAKAVRKALLLYEDPQLLSHFRKNGMTADFSWKRTTGEYVRVFRGILER
ncbi:MAG: glycogen synthase GlgA [Verrucomicrobiota bacterium]